MRFFETSVTDYPLTKRHIKEYGLKSAVRHLLLHGPITGLTANTGYLSSIGPKLQTVAPGDTRAQRIEVLSSNVHTCCAGS